MSVYVWVHVSWGHRDLTLVTFTTTNTSIAVIEAQVETAYAV